MKRITAMSKINHCVLSSALIAILCTFGIVSQAQSNDNRLMTDADYKTFLSQVEAVLPKWETALKGIDLERVPRLLRWSRLFGQFSPIFKWKFCFSV